MQIELSATELILAVREYVSRRGVAPENILDVFIRGGRKGKSGTATVNIETLANTSLPKAPQVYGDNVIAVPEENPVEMLTEPEDAPQLSFDFDAHIPTHIEDLPEDYADDEKDALKTSFNIFDIKPRPPFTGNLFHNEEDT